jgi:hypothetical protein
MPSALAARVNNINSRTILEMEYTMGLEDDLIFPHYIQREFFASVV